MKERILDKYASDKLELVDNSGDEAELLDNLGVCGYLRGIRDRAIMLELRHKDGNVTAFPYSYLSRAEFDPSESITLYFGAVKVTLSGRNLNSELRPNVRLFLAIIRHRITWVQEAVATQSLEALSTGLIVETIALD